MQGFDFGHLIVIIFIAVLVVGPSRLPDIFRRLGELSREGFKAQQEFAQALQEGVQEEDKAEPGAQPGPGGSAGAGAGTAGQPSRWQDFLRHMDELRTRLLISIVAILAFTALAYTFSDTIIHLLRAPANDIVLHAFSPMDGFIIRFRVAFYTGLVLAIPVWVYQLFAYLAPGIWPELEHQGAHAAAGGAAAGEGSQPRKRFELPAYRKQYLITLGAMASSFLLFIVGAMFGYLMLSNMISVLTAMFGSEIQYFPNADQYISFVVFFLIAMGAGFQLPLVLLLLMKIGIVSPDTLRKGRRFAYFIIFVFAEIVTPVSDPIVAPLVVMVPMAILFELALFVSRFVVSKPRPAAAVQSTPRASA